LTHGWELFALGACGLLLAVSGCSTEAEGPTPELSGEPGASDPAERTVEPPFQCNAELENNWVRIRGEKFSPFVRDAFEDEPEVETPTIRLERTKTFENVRDDGDTTEYTFDDSGTEANPDEQTDRLRWKDRQTLEVKVDPELELGPGVYDLTVTNPTGEEVGREQAFALLPRPKVESVEPDLGCHEDRKVDVTVSGHGFLEGPDGQVSRVQIGDEDRR